MPPDKIGFATNEITPVLLAIDAAEVPSSALILVASTFVASIKGVKSEVPK